MKMRILVSMCLVVALLCSCATPTLVEHENYKIYKEDGKWYLEDCPDNSSETQKQTENMKNSSDASMGVMLPKFETVSEMRETIIGGTLSDDQITALRVYNGNENDPLEIYDPYKMLDPAAPGDIKFDYVLLYGDYYSVEFIEKDSLGCVVCCDKETYEKAFQNEYGLTEKHSIISETIVSDRNARVVLSQTEAAEFKHAFYTVTTKYGGTLYVKEKYVLSYTDTSTDLKVSDSIPKAIDIFGSDGENYFYGWIRGLEERPSVEWLQSFGLVS